MTRAFTIAAISVPVVYTQEGDHDPNGMVFVPQKLVPLLKWCRALWYDTANLDADRGPTTLPRLHHRRQRAQLVIDLLERLDAMIARLMRGTEEDQALLARHIARETFGTRDDCHHYDSDPHRDHDEARRYHASDRDRAVRMNFERVLEELDIALTDLRRTRGLAEWNEPDVRTGVQSALADAEERFLPPPVRLVSLTPAQRHDLHEHWRVQERIIARAIADWLDQRKPTASDRQLRSLAQAAGLSDEWLARLIFNDHVSGTAGRCDRFNPVKPWPMLRPLVLRGCVGEQIDIELHNLLSRRPVDLFVQGQVMTSAVCPPGGRVNVTFDLGDDEGVWPLNDVADVRGDEAGTNTHGLFGAVIAEPAGTHWLDPETGDDLTACDWAAPLDVILQPADHTPDAGAQPYVDYETDRANGVRRCFREFTVFIHDEPEIHSGLHTVGDHSLMPLSYRAAPMHNRLPHRMRELVASSRAHPLPAPGTIDLRAFGWELGEELDEVFLTARDSDGRWLERIAGEEQHHSSWLFGDPPTHVQRAYAGDPCRVRLVHAGVKETHIYHLHVHEWHAVRTQTAKPSVHGEAAYDRANGAPVYAAGSGAETGKGSHLLDSVTISPQVGMTIDPLFGSGSRQKAIGDIIWHCHLYPHFHHGMWGLWRSYDRLVDGTRPYPDGSYCPPLMPLPDRPVPAPEHDKPGFPWFVDGTYPAKSPPPPAAIAEHRNGRRILLGMPDASPLERAAMADGCRDGKTPGALFVDLDRLATAWNTAAGLFRGGGRQRKISYDVEVRHDRIAYNVDGWYDPRGHHYRLMKATIREMDEAGEYQIVEEMDFPHDPGTHPEPIFPRANHGDIVEWRQFNTLPAFDADQYDFAQLAVECGLHVHLVKFDVLAADGSATGWNYLSGASSPGAVGAGAPGEQRNVSLHRWVVDEEFGPCFFHDHLLANFRQRRGLFAALMVQPHGSQWHRADDQSRRAWDAQQAVIVPPVESALPPYREACLAVADYVPMLNRHGKALNPPPVLSGMSDPGVMGVNYRCAPLRFRGQDPSTWFSSAVRADRNFAGDVGDPDTPIIRSYPGERLRIRLIQGSHEEQHSFTAHGLRWRRDWGHPGATLVNQQTLGISEAFTLDINPADASRYGAGDHLWHFGTMDDLWLGTWGLVRVLPPTPENRARFAPLPAPSLTPEEALKAMRDAAKPLRREDGDPVRTYVVAAQCHEHHYLGDILTDPWGLIYRAVPCDADAIAAAIEEELDVEASGVGAVPPDKGFNRLLAAAGGRMGTEEPLVLRALAGEWVRVILVNDLLRADDDDLERQRAGRPRFGPEPSPARLPTEHRDWRGHPDRRTVSPRVSLHPALLHYDVAFADGGYVGLNPDTTIAARRQRDDAHGMHGGNVEQPGPDLQAPDGGVLAHAGHGARRNWREYWWWADPKLAPRPGADGGMGQVCYLHDMADIRNHRHHGLVGALVVLPTDVRPYRSGSDSVEGWTDFTADIRAAESGALIARETFWFAQDGLRFFVNGDPLAPMADAEPDLDPVDGGQKAVNYRTYPVHRGRIGPGGPAPILDTQAGDKVWLRVLGANDKPRQYGVVIHGARWPQAPWMDGNAPMIGALSGIAPCRVEDVAFTLQGVGDHPVRPGNFLWPTQQGMWARIAAR